MFSTMSTTPRAVSTRRERDVPLAHPSNIGFSFVVGRCRNGRSASAGGSSSREDDLGASARIDSARSDTERVIRVLVADDQQLLRAGFRVILEAEPDIEVVGEAVDGVEAVERGRAAPDPTSSSWTSGCRASTASPRPSS